MFWIDERADDPIKRREGKRGDYVKYKKAENIPVASRPVSIVP